MPVAGQGSLDARRVPRPPCSPYLAFSVIVAAGLKGIDEGYELPPETVANVFELT
jgi:glutamine synthetase